MIFNAAALLFISWLTDLVDSSSLSSKWIGPVRLRLRSRANSAIPSYSRYGYYSSPRQKKQRRSMAVHMDSRIDANIGSEELEIVRGQIRHKFKAGDICHLKTLPVASKIRPTQYFECLKPTRDKLNWPWTDIGVWHKRNCTYRGYVFSPVDRICKRMKSIRRQDSFCTKWPQYCDPYFRIGYYSHINLGSPVPFPYHVSFSPCPIKGCTSSNYQLVSGPDDDYEPDPEASPEATAAENTIISVAKEIVERDLAPKQPEPKPVIQKKQLKHEIPQDTDRVAPNSEKRSSAEPPEKRKTNIILPQPQSHLRIGDSSDPGQKRRPPISRGRQSKKAEPFHRPLDGTYIVPIPGPSPFYPGLQPYIPEPYPVFEPAPPPPPPPPQYPTKKSRRRKVIPRPCPLVKEPFDNAQHGGICSWMLDPLAPFYGSRYYFLQCAPASPGIYCGRWHKRPCAPGTRFDVSAQICVHDEDATPYPLGHSPYENEQSSYPYRRKKEKSKLRTNVVKSSAAVQNLTVYHDGLVASSGSTEADRAQRAIPKRHMEEGPPSKTKRAKHLTCTTGTVPIGQCNDMNECPGYSTCQINIRVCCQPIMRG